MRATSASITSGSMGPGSGRPSEKAIPALVVASARKPSAASSFALPAFQGLGSRRISSPSCSLRNAWALSDCVALM